MAHIVADRVRETSTTSGTTDFTLAGNVAGHRTFALAPMSNGDTCWYCAYSFSTNDVEIGTGTKGTGTLQRTAILYSTNSNAKVSFGSDAKDIFLGIPAAFFLLTLGGTLTGALNTAASVTVASATTTDLGAAASNYVNISGTTTIAGFGTIASSAIRFVKFAGVLTLTHNGTSLILPGAANIVTAAGDTLIAASEGSGNWRVLDYRRATEIPNLKSDKTRTINAQTGTTYTFGLTDADTIVTFSNASPITATVPPNSSVPLPAGTQIELSQQGAGKLSLAQGVGVTINSVGGQKSLAAQYAGGSLFKTATDVWTFVGLLSA